MSDPTRSGSATGSGTPQGWTPPSVEELQALLPEYEIKSILGRGGMGAVYKGSQRSLRRAVAIKVLPETLASTGEADRHQYVERFKREARAMAGFDHPAILRVHDFGETGVGHLYIVMEFVDGMDIEQYIQAVGGTVDPEHAVSIVSHVLDALEYAHSKGIVHRDIKPANVLLNQAGRVKIADFGLAKEVLEGGAGGGAGQRAAQMGLTMADVAMGTPDYMAPETLEEGATPDHRVDLYAVGVMLYKMLTGKLPRGVFKLPSETNRDLDPRFDELVARGMAGHPEDRFQSASEFRSKLGEMISRPVRKVEAGQASGAVSAVVAVSRLKFSEAESPDDRKDEASSDVAPAREPSPGRGKMVVALALCLGLAAVAYLAFGPSDDDETPVDPAAVAGAGADEAPGHDASVDGSSQSPEPGDEVALAVEGEASASDPSAGQWPVGAHYRTMGRFRAWSSQADDPVIDLARLQGLDDARQVHLVENGWLVLQENGDLIGSHKKMATRNIRRICSGQTALAGLISEDGTLMAVNSGGIVDIDVPADLGPVADAYVGLYHRVALLDDGSLHVWGDAHDPTQDLGYNSWKAKPELPPGSTAVAMSATPCAMAVHLDDGRLVAWNAKDGEIAVPKELSAAELDRFVLDFWDLYAISHGSGRVRVWGDYGEQLEVRDEPEVTAPIKAMRQGAQGILFLGAEGKPWLNSGFSTAVPQIGEALAAIKCKSIDLVTAYYRKRKSKDDSSSVARLLWFDEAAPPLQERGADDVETIEIDGNTYFTWKGEHFELQALENPCSAKVMAEFLAALDKCYRYWATTFGRDPVGDFGGRLVIRDFRKKDDAFRSAAALQLTTGVAPYVKLADEFRSFEHKQSVKFGLVSFEWLFLEDEIGKRISRPVGNEQELHSIGEVLTASSLAPAGMAAVGSRPTITHWQEHAEESLRRWREGSNAPWSDLVAAGSVDIDGIVTHHLATARGIVFALCEEHGESFLRRWLGYEVPRRPIATNDQAADDNFVISASMAAGEDLSERFEKQWRWKVSNAAKAEIDRQLTARPWMGTWRDAETITPKAEGGQMRSWTGRHFRIETTSRECTPRPMGELLSIKDSIQDYWQWLFDDPKVGNAGANGAMTLREVVDRARPMGDGVATCTVERLHPALRRFNDERRLERWLGGCGNEFLWQRLESRMSYPEVAGPGSGGMVNGLSEALVDIALERVHAPVLPAEDFGLRRWQANRALRHYEHEFEGGWLEFTQSRGGDGDGGSAAAAGMMLELYVRFGDEFLRRLLAEEIPELPEASTNQQAIDGFFLAACRAARSDLSDEFIHRWRWPVSEEVHGAMRKAYPYGRIDGIVRAAGWQDLMPRLSGQQSSYRRGEWLSATAGAGLLCKSPPTERISSIVAIETEPLASYDLRCRILRHKGTAFSFLLPTAHGEVGLSATTGAERFGLEFFRGRDLWSAPRTHPVDLSRVKVGEVQQWLVEVRPDRLAVSIDGDLYREWNDVDWRDYHQNDWIALRHRSLLGVAAFERKPDEMEIHSFEIRLGDSELGEELTFAPPPALVPAPESVLAIGIAPPALAGLDSRVANFQRARLRALEEVLAPHREGLDAAMRSHDDAALAGQDEIPNGYREAIEQLDLWSEAVRAHLESDRISPLMATPYAEVPDAALEVHKVFADKLATVDATLLISFLQSLERWTTQLERNRRTGEVQMLKNYIRAFREPGYQALSAGSASNPGTGQAGANQAPVVPGIQGSLEGFTTGTDPLDLSAADGIDDLVQVQVHLRGWVALRAGGQTVCSQGENREKIARIVQGPGGSYGVVDSEGKLEVIGEDLGQYPSKPIEDVVDVRLGYGHGLAILKGGDLAWWGSNYDNGWGKPPGGIRRDVSAIAARGGCAAAVDEEGRLYAWHTDDLRFDSELRADVRAIAFSDPNYGQGHLGAIVNRAGPAGEVAAEGFQVHVRSAQTTRWLKGVGYNALLFGNADGTLTLDYEQADDHPRVVSTLNNLRDCPREAVSLSIVGGSAPSAKLLWIEPAAGQ